MAEVGANITESQQHSWRALMMGITLLLLAAMATRFLVGDVLRVVVYDGPWVPFARADPWEPGLTLALMLATVVSPMASGVVAVGLFGATWIAGVVGGVGAALDKDGLAQVGSVSRMLLPTDGLWRGAMHAFQDPAALVQFGAEMEGFPFLSESPLTLAYLAWAAVWVAMVWGLAAASFLRKDL